MEQLFAMCGSQAFEHCATLFRQPNEDLSTVLLVRHPPDQPLLLQPVRQSYSAMMADLHPFSQLPDGQFFPAGVADDGKQCLVLLQGQAGFLDCIFTEVQETAQGVAKFCQGLVISFGKSREIHHRFTHVFLYAAWMRVGFIQIG